jgi:FG-GAP repeat
MAALFAAVSANAQVIFPKIDTTVKVGKVGYHVDCRNKKVDENDLNIRPMGFNSEAKPVEFMIRGRVAKAEIDDLNGDGYPDLVLYVYMDSSAVFGTVYVFVSKENKSIIGCFLPDPMMDGKINEGYKGHDKFSLMEGYLLEKFPIYKAGDDKDNPSGGTRAILYQLVPDEGDRFKFQKVRTYDTH